MRLPELIFSIIVALLPFARADEFDDAAAAPLAKNLRTTTLYSWPLSAPSPTPIGTVSFAPRAHTGSFKSAGLQTIPSEELVRIGLYDTVTGSWSGSVAAPDLVASVESGVAITLRVDGSGNVWHVELAQDVAAVCTSSARGIDGF